jgi:hypothetical protein
MAERILHFRARCSLWKKCGTNCRSSPDWNDRNAEAGPDGAGDHARAGGTFLTGVRVKKTAGSDIYAGASIDQVAAQQIGHLTSLPIARIDLRRGAQVREL